MRTTSPHAALESEWYLPAWIFSAVFHACALVAVGMSLEGAPRGASQQPLRSAGIVLKRTSTEGDLYEGASDIANQAAVEKQSETEELEPTPSDDATASESTDSSQSLETAVAIDATSTDVSQSSTSEQRAAAANRGSPVGDGYTKVSVFGVEGAGNKFVYVFDRSASMEGPPLAAAQRQLVESLESLEDVHQFHIIFFNHKLRSFDITAGGRRIAFGTERNKKLASNFVRGITADGGTDRFTALKQALAFRPDVVFFLTDADDPMSASEMADIERLQSRIGTAICVIEFGRTAAKPSKNFLTELARLSGGQYGYVNTAQLKP
jgi:Ca-activated chloride channel family protein